MDHTAQKLTNLLINKLESRLQLPVLRSLPPVVDLVLTKACNLACTFCKDYETEGAKRVSLENFERVAAQLFPTARRLNLCSGGEPYLHPGLEELLRVAKRYQVSTWLLSNGTLCTEARMRTIVRERLVSAHGFSVDGFEAATVEAIRVNARLATILESIERLVRLRVSEGNRELGIVVRYALMRSNIEELPAAVRRWGELGIDTLECGYLSLANGIPREQSMYFHQPLLEEVCQEARKVAAEYPRLKVILPPLIRDEVAKRTAPVNCRSPWSFVMIDTNGEVLPCYRAFEALRFSHLYDAQAVPFAKVWNSPHYQSLRGTVNREGHKFFPYCGSCELRYGYGHEDAHLGDESWIARVGDALKKPVDHQRPVRGNAAANRDKLINLHAAPSAGATLPVKSPP
jgi:MoaA/NifB/PqqE/SkfB family radical SAM enzyme